jgi:hypothetical protein
MLVLKVASWVASAMARRVELWDNNIVIPPALADRAAVLAFGDKFGPQAARRFRIVLARARLAQAPTVVKLRVGRTDNPSSGSSTPATPTQPAVRGAAVMARALWTSPLLH